MSRRSDHHQLETDKLEVGDRVAREIHAENITFVPRQYWTAQRQRKKAIKARVLRTSPTLQKTSNPTYNPLTKAARKRLGRVKSIIARDGDCCWICKGVFLNYDEMTFEHVIPLSDGGSNALENVKLAHEPCNQEKGGIHGPNSNLAGMPSKPRRRNGIIYE